MSTLPSGLYEQLINRIIRQNLIQLTYRFEDKKIDSAESSQILADYISYILSEVLDYLNGDEAVNDRVNLCNSIIHHISACLDKGSFGLPIDSQLAERIRFCN